jgi:dTDP-4-dehydrorhamnose 3,5-epimerase
MKFHELGLSGPRLVELEAISDERGWFARAWCEREFAEQGIQARWVQSNLSYNRRRGTLRGLHYQAPPEEEPKLVQCIAGSLYDVIVDLRPGSATFLRWIAVELDAREPRLLYVPPGFAHGFQVLEDHTSLFYLMGAPYVPAAARGIRWDDPRLAVRWPVADPVLSERDRTFPDLDPATLGR